MLFFDMNVHTIYIMLGDKCNFTCKYCIQGKNKKLSTSLQEIINPEIYNFIKKISSTNKNPVTILFYGGEPLLYFDNIKDIVNKTKYFNVKYQLITNGSLMTEEIINYLNYNKFNLIVSWDGKQSTNTRNCDIFRDKEIKKIIFKSPNLTINSVISAKNYPLKACNDIQELANEYMNYHKGNASFSVNFDEIIDNSLVDRELLNMDYDKLSEDVKIIINEVSQVFDINPQTMKYENTFTELFVKYSYLYRYLDYIKEIENNPNISTILSPCKDGFYRLGIDLQGNLYSCHDSREIIGNINDLNLIAYITNYFKYDNTKELYNTLCNKCKWYKICHGRCKLLTLEARKNHTCKLKEAVGKPLFDYLDNLKI